MSSVSHRRDSRRLGAVGGLSIAALTAIAALLGGDFGDTEWRVIGSSLGLAIASAVAAAGASQRICASGLLRQLGTATAVLAGIASVLLLAGLWADDWGSEEIWRGFGCESVLAIAGSHACVVLGARRRSGSYAVGLPSPARWSWPPSTPSAGWCRSRGSSTRWASRAPSSSAWRSPCCSGPCCSP
jgi:hypothetical protein